MKNVIALLLLAICAIAIGLNGTEKRTLTFDDVIACVRLSDLQFSPDGKWIVFTVTTVNEEDNSSHSDIWIISSDGEKLKQLTTHSNSSWHPRWSPDGNKLAFLSSRSGKTQIWLLSMEGGEPQQLTKHYTGAGEFVWSNDGKKIAFTTRVYHDCEDQKCNEEKDKEKEQNEVKARVYEDLLFRHWDEWWDHKRSHIFIISLETKEIVDVTPGDYDSPPISLGSGFTFSPDDKELYFTSNHDEMIAISTNNDIWSVPLEGRDKKFTPVKISTKFSDRNFKGNDHSPQFSPDGKYLSFLSMRRERFEADKNDLILKDLQTGQFRNITTGFNLSISSYKWLPDGKGILCSIDSEGRYKIFKLDINTGKLKALVEEGSNRSITVSPGGKTFAFLHQTTTSPSEIWIGSVDGGKLKQITFFNNEILKNIVMNDIEDFWFKSNDGTDMHGFLVKPPYFNNSKKYPAIFFIHGGPQGAWHNSWHYRWNVQLWSAQGYVMVMINPRGSTGYGQEFTDAISKDWGGKVFEDLVAGQKYVVESFDFINQDKIAAAGASYGGYMINWTEGHIESFKYPFKCLISHDGAFNLYSKYLTTEELWFPEWEFDGPYWENDKYYEMWSPHKFIKNFKTPMLIIHGEKDYRLDFGESLMAFTALRRKGVPAKLVLFPDEGHWVQKPKNSRFWHKTIFDWLDQYIKR
jgi:dipeptidyl aminopeptidase/acylaminoacyl peptidase